MKGPDGWVLIRETPNSPIGYWFIKAYTNREHAERDRKHNPGSKIKAIRFIGKAKVEKANG